MTEQQMIKDGWRRCAVGQRTTEHCGMVEEARAQERARIVAIIRDEMRAWHDGERDYAYEDGATDSLQAVLNSAEDTSHE